MQIQNINKEQIAKRKTKNEKRKKAWEKKEARDGEIEMGFSHFRLFI